MLTYWFMYLIPASFALLTRQKDKLSLAVWIFIGFVFSLIIGYRYEVGGDWVSYLEHYNDMYGVPFSDVMIGGRGDPGHRYLNWLVFQWDWGVYGTNIFYGTVFMIGLIRFSRMQIYPWIAMAAAVPYLVIVVVMGYSRQGVAIGLFLWAISYLQKKNLFMYVLLLLIASLFHKSAIILFPLGVLLYGKRMIFRILMIVPVVYGAWDLLVEEQQSKLLFYYVDKEMESKGALIRVFMNFVPSLILFKYRKMWKREFDDYSFWFWIAIGSVASMFFVNFASTAVDRVALYFIPIQLIVFSRLPFLLRKQISPTAIKAMIVVGYALVLFVWLNFGRLSFAWLPYKNILFSDIL